MSLDLDALIVEHTHPHCCIDGSEWAGEEDCMPYRLAALALDLQGLLNEEVEVSRRAAQRVLDLQGKVADAWDEAYKQAVKDIDWERPWQTRRITENPHRVVLADQPKQAVGRARLVDWCRYCGAIEPEHTEDCRTLANQPEQEVAP